MSGDLILGDYLIYWLCGEVWLIELRLFKMQLWSKHLLDELVICLQEKRELKAAEGPGDGLSSQSFAKRFWYLHLDLMPQLITIVMPQ